MSRSQANINRTQHLVQKNREYRAPLRKTRLMPCQLRLPRLHDSRHTHQHTFRHAVTCRAVRQPFRQVHDAPSSAAREAARSFHRRIAQEQARQDALRRLNQGIDPNDLSATLEAHRESNRASIIHRVTTTASDPAIIRPSFIHSSPTIRVVPAKRRRAGREYEGKDPPSLSHLSETVAKSTDSVDAYQLRRLKSAADLARDRKHAANLEGRNAEHYTCWSEFLHTHEQPLLAEIPEFDPTDRRTFFGLLRRVSNIIQREQNRSKTHYIIKGLADPSILLYSGIPRPLMSGLKGYQEPEPWNRRPTFRPGYSHTQWFDLEIEKFAEWMQLTPSEEAARAKLTETLLQLVPMAAPETGSEPFGSQVTGLAMPNSDIDIRIYERNPKKLREKDQQFADKEEKHAWQAQQRMERKTRMTAHLTKVQSHLSKHPDFEQIELTDAHYPLVKAVHTPTGIKVQLVAAKPSNSSRTAIKKCLDEIPHLKPLFLLVKTTLNLRDLSDPWHGGFGSYTVFMMCAAALKLAALQTAKDSPAKSLSENFLYLLEFWGDFNVYKMAMSVDPPLVYTKRAHATAGENEAAKTNAPLAGRLRIGKPTYYKPYLLALQDPADPFNDLGRSSFAILDLQRTLKKLHRDLVEDLEDPTRRRHPGALLKQVVGRSDRYFDDIRIPVDLWGSQFVVEEEVVEGEVRGVQHEEEGVQPGKGKPAGEDVAKS